MSNQEIFFKKMFGNIVIRGYIECLTGMHIGGGQDSIQIGGIDSSVIRDPRTGEPYIPGSSLKGKMRSIVEKISEGKNGEPLPLVERAKDRKNTIKRHECSNYNEALNCPVCRIFGATSGDSHKDKDSTKKDNFPSRIIVRDSKLINKEEISQNGVVIMEIKSENTIDRLTSAAMPRTIERVPAGAKFEFEIIYKAESQGKMEEDKQINKEHLKTDLENIMNSLDIIEKDGIGKSVSRGYGRVKFNVTEFKFYSTKNEISEAGLIAEEGNCYDITECRKEISKIVENIKG